MKDTIEQLRKLQEIDNQVTEIARSREVVLGKIDELRRVLDMGAAEQEERSQKLAEAERFCRDANEELQRGRDQIRRLQARLGSLTKTKEFNAATRETEAQQQACKQKEEEIAKLSAEIVRYREAFEQNESSLAAMRDEVSAEETRRGEELDRLAKSIEEVQKTREEVEKKIEPRVARRYKRIAKARDGCVVVEVRDGRCMGCNRQIQPQLRIELLKGLKLETCPSCSRFIYIPEDEVQRYQQD